MAEPSYKVPHLNPENRRRMLRTLTAAEAADAGRWYSEQGDYRAAAAFHQLAAALEETDHVLKMPTVAVPLVAVPMRDEQPRSHAPTTCAWLVYDPRPGMPPSECGELIRWEEPQVSNTITSDDVLEALKVGRWVHVNDGRLGESNHPATPGE
jgi:hypothetical protein